MTQLEVSAEGSPGSRSAALFEQIAEVVAAGESSYARLRGGHQLVIDRADGSTIWDADGNPYIDYCGGFGVNLFGHKPEFVWEAVERTVAQLGFHIGFPHRLCGEVGELVHELVPSVEQLRFANSGTEATQAAVRLARAATGGDVIVKFAGHFHGWADHLCAGWTAGSSSLTPTPDSIGIPLESVANVFVVPWNDLHAVEAAIEAAGSRFAGVICEPLNAAYGLIPPLPGFLEKLAECVRAAGGLVIFDEVMVGFRLAPGGAQEFYGVRPDITTLGKIIGGGFALAAFGGSREVMRLEAENRVVHGGTYTGSPVALAAAKAVLTRIVEDPGLYGRLEAVSERLAGEMDEAFRSAGLAAHVRRTGSLLQPVFSKRPEVDPTCAEDLAPMQNEALYRSFCDVLEAEGVYCNRYSLGRWFLSTAHTDQDISSTIRAIRTAAHELGRALPHLSP